MTDLLQADLELTLTATGSIHSLRVGEETIAFRHDDHASGWYGCWDGADQRPDLRQIGDRKFGGRQGEMEFLLRYELADGHLIIRAGLRNHGHEVFQPRTCGYKLGLNTWMDRYPDWNDRYFPTLLRCEATHFWGYAMTPGGRLLGIASPDPIGSWSVDWNQSDYGDWGHRIYTSNLDLLNEPPLPDRHPDGCHAIAPGEERWWSILLCPIPDLTQVKPRLAALCHAPLIELDRYTLAEGESTCITLYSTVQPCLEVAGQEVEVTPAGHQRWRAKIQAPATAGAWRISATAAGRRSAAIVSRRQPWSWYLLQARQEALRCPQRPSTHLESWLGLYSLALARRHLPEPEIDALSEETWQEVLAAMVDVEAAAPRYHPARLANTGCLISALVQRYAAFGNLETLRLAAGLADHLIRFQRHDGAFYGAASGNQGHGHYTSVVYPAKSLMELILAEQKLVDEEQQWAPAIDRQVRAVRAAMDNLAALGDNLGTEGEITFEDGMISCSFTQLAMYALYLSPSVDRQRYVGAALRLARAHRCLQQQLVPDARQRGATLRFWEAQYDVRMRPNMFNSPHGWSSWKSYGTWYLYLLTGEVEWLRDTMDTLGACAQVIEPQSGRLRWAFVPDPYVRFEQFGTLGDRQLDGTVQMVDTPCQEGIIGETYVDMISDHYPYWCCDNDVHEHFKCLAEIGLTQAYVVWHGELETWNCQAWREGDRLIVEPHERLVDRLHLNLTKPMCVECRFAADTVCAEAAVGLTWLEARS